LENALAADREKHWKAHSSPESESESTEGRAITSRPRSRKASGVASRNLKSSRKRGDTVTSSRTAISRGDSTDTAQGENPSSKAEEARTPTRAEIFDQKRDHHHHHHADPLPKTTTTGGSKMNKNDNDDASTSEASASIDRPRTTTPITPALTPALTGTTDDSDTDFQSAYSATPSPRESLRGNFDDRMGGSDTLHTVEKRIPGSFETSIVRDRVSSIVTAVPQSSPTFSDDTVVSGRGAISRR